MESRPTRQEKAAARRRRRDELVRASLQEELNPRWTSRAGRRRLVGLAVGVLALTWAAVVVCWFLAPSDTAMWTTFALCGVAVVAGGLVAGQLVRVTRGVAGVPEHLLDERQQTERLRAHAAAHRVTLALLLVTAILIPSAVPDEGDVATLPTAALFLFFLALLVTVAALPLLLAAWRMPDPLPDDED